MDTLSKRGLSQPPFAALILSVAIAAALPRIACAETPAASSNTVIGPNVMLADGADALMKGDWQRGVQLTQMGLAFAISQQDRASGLANLCAGFVGNSREEHPAQRVSAVQVWRKVVSGRVRIIGPHVCRHAREPVDVGSRIRGESQVAGYEVRGLEHPRVRDAPFVAVDAQGGSPERDVLRHVVERDRGARGGVDGAQRGRRK